jgi:hypothetical protein
MAWARQEAPAWLTALYIVAAIVFIPILVVASPFWLAYRLYDAHRNSPEQLERKAQEMTDALWAQARSQARSARLVATRAFSDDLLRRCDFGRDDGRYPCYEFLLRMLNISDALYDAECFEEKALPPPPRPANSIAGGRYRDYLTQFIIKVAHPAAPETLRQCLVDSFTALSSSLPPAARQTAEELSASVEGSAPPPMFSVALLEMMADVGQTVEDLVLPFYSAKARELRLFAGLREQLDRNQHAASGVPYTIDNRDSADLVMPSEYDGPPDEIVSAYLRDTPFDQVFSTRIPFAVPVAARLEHWHLVGSSGSGKTQLLQTIILNDLSQPDPPALIVIDSQGDMLRKIERLALFAPGGALSDRLVVIDPEDEYSPALNMFDMTTPRLGGYSKLHREQIEAGIIELYNYLFGALASDLTSKQGVAFAYIARLMMAIPNATIRTLLEVVEESVPSLEKSRFREAVRTLDPIARSFFEHQFFSRSTFGPTKLQIARRLYDFVRVPAFLRMFSAEKNKLDMFEAMQAGKVILVNTSRSLLKDGSSLFGRYMIALAVAAAYERVAIPERERRPAYLMVDEAADYFDESLEALLSQARKFKLGLLFAHQHMEQLSPSLRSAVATNTTIKMAGLLSDRDARALAPDMKTTPDFLTSMRKRGAGAEFACYVRNATDTALRLTIPFGLLESAPTMSDEEHARLKERNRERYCTAPSATDEVYGPPTAAERSTDADIDTPLPPRPTRPATQNVRDDDAPAAVAAIPAPKMEDRRPERNGNNVRQRTAPETPPPPLGRGGRQHQYLQQLIKQMAEERGWRAVIEEPVPGAAGRIDVALKRGERRIACEISVTSTRDQELGNIRKSLAAGYAEVVLIATSDRQRVTLRKHVSEALEEAVREKVRYLLPEELLEYLTIAEAPSEQMIRGYRVKVQRQTLDPADAQAKRQAIAAVIAKSLKKED